LTEQDCVLTLDNVLRQHTGVQFRKTKNRSRHEKWLDFDC